MNPSNLNRRQFIHRTAGTAAAITALPLVSRANAQDSPNETIIVGVMGMSRGLHLAGIFEKLPNCSVKYVCDTDTGRANQAAVAIEKINNRKPQAIADYRRILEDQEVDVLVCAAPNHWHAPATIFATRAGKHVYVEKPCSQTAAEGELMVTEARRNKRIVQMGNQRRSWSKIIEAVEMVRGGEIGHVYYSRAWYANTRPTIGRGNVAEPPANLDYELWQGPAPRRPYKTNLIPYNWHWFWHYGGGELANNGIHAIDLSRWGLNVDFPIRVTAAGGRYAFDDDQETPDTMMVTCDFEEKKTIIWEGLSCNRRGIEGDSFGVTFHGDKGTIVLSSSGYTRYDATNREKAKVPGPGDDTPHLQNFLDCIRACGTDGPTKLPNSDIEGGHKSTLLCHLGNIAYRTGRTLHCDPRNGHIKNDEEAMKLWSREYDAKFDPFRQV